MAEHEVANGTHLIISTELQPRAIATTVIPAASDTPVSAKLFTINESKSINSPHYSDLGTSMSADDSTTLSPIMKPSRTVLIDEERGDGAALEVGDIRCFCVPSRVHGFGDFVSRTWSWLLLNKEQILSPLTGKYSTTSLISGYQCHINTGSYSFFLSVFNSYLYIDSRSDYKFNNCWCRTYLWPSGCMDDEYYKLFTRRKTWNDFRCIDLCFCIAHFFGQESWPRVYILCSHLVRITAICFWTVSARSTLSSDTHPCCEGVFKRHGFYHCCQPSEACTTLTGSNIFKTRFLLAESYKWNESRILVSCFNTIIYRDGNGYILWNHVFVSSGCKT
jgi:hypothetical protein